jgi:hypothetical protein
MRFIQRQGDRQDVPHTRTTTATCPKRIRGLSARKAPLFVLGHFVPHLSHIFDRGARLSAGPRAEGFCRSWSHSVCPALDSSCASIAVMTSGVIVLYPAAFGCTPSTVSPG